jgi:hypothetical protein
MTRMILTLNHGSTMLQAPSKSIKALVNCEESRGMDGLTVDSVS